MVRTAQENKAGANTEEEEEGMKKNAYEPVMWHHDSESLYFAIWSNIKLVQTLFNFHTSKGANEGLKRKR